MQGRVDALSAFGTTGSDVWCGGSFHSVMKDKSIQVLLSSTVCSRIGGFITMSLSLFSFYMWTLTLPVHLFCTLVFWRGQITSYIPSSHLFATSFCYLMFHAGCSFGFFYLSCPWTFHYHPQFIISVALSFYFKWKTVISVPNMINKLDID